MKIQRIAGALCMCLALHFAEAQQKEKFSQVKIFVTKKQVANLQAQGVDIDHAYYNPTEQALITTLEQSDILKLNRLGITYQITVDDEEQAYLRGNTKPVAKTDEPATNSNTTGRLLFNTPDRSFASTIVTPAAFNAGSMGGYLTFADMKGEIDQMVANYPNLVKVESIGKTYENRDIWAVTISDNISSSEVEPEVLYTGMHHAREPLAMENLIFFMHYLLENYSTNLRIKEIVDSRQLVFIPCLNPDGYVYNQGTNPSGGGMWRKNRQPNSNGSFGQDLNRNYGYGFDYPNSGSSDVPTDQNYHGDAAFQAKETQIIRDYLRLHKFRIAINYHSYGGYWIHGNTVPTYSLSGTDSAIIKSTGAMATRNSFYEVGTPMETVGYNGNGTIEDWCMAGDLANRPKIYSISPEVGLGISTFWPSGANATATYNLIVTYCKEVFFSNLQAALFGAGYVEASDVTSLNANLGAAKTGNTDVLIRRLGVLDTSVTVTILPYKNVTSASAPVTINSIPTYLGSATANFTYTLHPSIANGQFFQYIVKTETAGLTTLDTITKFYNASVPFQDDMEAGVVGTKWTSTGWDYTTKSAFSGTKSLSQGVTGSAYVNNRNVTIKPVTNLNLSGVTSAYLSFWTRFKSQPGYDKVQVKVSTNGGTSFTTLPGLHTVTENKGTLANAPSLTGYQDYWVKEIVDLKSVVNNPSVIIRFDFTSDASVTDEGFYIDELEVVTTTAPMLILPIHFLDVKAIRTGKEASIRWESEIDPSHLYFEVERSLDGKNFSSIYKTTDRQNVLFATDRNPALGNNYYRIKAVSSNGVQYSKIVTVTMTQKMAISLYPNPVTEQLHLELSDVEAGRYQFEILNQNGQVASHREVRIAANERDIKLSVSGLNAGSYLLLLRDEKGELVEARGFVKM